jgi:cystathionine beta-lyase family protein involved in aluminum resistance
MEWWQLLKVKPEIADIILAAEKKTAAIRQDFHATCLFNQARVLKAFQELKISDECFNSNEGYGYNDYGREKLEALFARIFQGEEAIVRPHLVSGTHTIFSCFRGLLRPGDRLLSITGKPYDTLYRALGLKNGGEGGLLEWGIAFDSIELDDFNLLEDESLLMNMLDEPTRVVFIQRSRGYDPYRSSLTVEKIGKLIKKIRHSNPDVTIFVDNCYGEFVEKQEPLEIGADVIAGSLIKNVGGGLVPTGGYIAGNKKCIEKISAAISAPGLGKELGAFVFNKRLFYQGIFMAPHITAEALKGAALFAAALESLGYQADPRFDQKRGDIVQAISLKNKEELQKICQAVQSASPVNAHITPVAGKTAGYDDLIYMAAGTFVQGASGEFSADAPLREPYTVYIQGGLTYEHMLLGLAAVLQSIL